MGTSFCAFQAKQLQHSIQIFRIAFIGHHSIESLAETFEVIVLHAVVMNAANTEAKVDCSVLLELLHFWVWPKPCTSSMCTSIPTFRSALQKNCGALTHLVNPSLSTIADAK